jgi:hypothetical protein
MSATKQELLAYLTLVQKKIEDSITCSEKRIWLKAEIHTKHKLHLLDEGWYVDDIEKISHKMYGNDQK